MHVDDRLATVLNARADGKVAVRVQYRQLLDLVGTTPAEARGDLLDAAHVRLAELAGLIPFNERARALAEPGIRLRNPRLIAMLAADHPAVGQAAVNAARLTEDQWLDLIPALPLAARSLVRARRDLSPAVEARLAQLGISERALPPATTASAEAETSLAHPRAPLPPDADAAAGDNILHLTLREEAPAGISTARKDPPDSDGISAIVRRIEAFRKLRENADAPQAANDAPRLPLDETGNAAAAGGTGSLRAFAFSTDATGRIGWADPAVAGMVCGMLVPAASDEDGAPVAQAFRHRQPIRTLPVRLEGARAIAGDWLLDAGPRFDAQGNFAGYAGRFRRPAQASSAVGTANPQADRVRQILHELRTPVNAIQGFAEVIHQQLFGAAPHEYRALAASIAADAARMLAGFDELDRLARLDTGALQIEPGSTDLAMTVAGIVHQLEHHTASRSSGFALSADQGELTVGLAAADVERLVWRVLATLAGAARPGEMLELEVRRQDGAVALSAALPAALAHIDDLFEATSQQTPQALSAGVFGSGFAMRLAAAEARAASGHLLREGARLQLILPRCDVANTGEAATGLTQSDAINNPAAEAAASAR